MSAELLSVTIDASGSLSAGAVRLVGDRREGYVVECRHMEGCEKLCWRVIQLSDEAVMSLLC